MVTENRLVAFLFDKGIVGKDKAVRRSIIAAIMAIRVRDLRELAEDARLDGHFVGYSTHATEGGIFLAGTDEEREEIFNRIRSECLGRLRQYSSLKRSLRDSHQARIPDLTK